MQFGQCSACVHGEYTFDYMLRTALVGKFQVGASSNELINTYAGPKKARWPIYQPVYVCSLVRFQRGANLHATIIIADGKLVA